MRVMVDASGCPASVHSQDVPEKAALVQAALKALKRWRFQPATKDGKPVRVFVYLKVAFRPLGETEYTIINGITLETLRSSAAN